MRVILRLSAEIILVGIISFAIPGETTFAQRRSVGRGCGKQAKSFVRPPCAITLDYMPGGLLTDGKLESKPQPKYPEAAKAKGISGSVFVLVMTDTEGVVTSAKILSGPPLLQDAALNAAKQVRVRPTKLDGKPIGIRGYVKYDFVLERASQ